MQREYSSTIVVRCCAASIRWWLLSEGGVYSKKYGSSTIVVRPPTHLLPKDWLPAISRHYKPLFVVKIHYLHRPTLSFCNDNSTRYVVDCGM